MIVVAIIGILAAVAILAYQDYVAKSKWAAAYGEISGFTTPIDVLVNEGDLGKLTCVIHGGPAAVKGKKIFMNRDAAGQWSCATDADQKYVGGTKCPAAA